MRDACTSSRTVLPLFLLLLLHTLLVPHARAVCITDVPLPLMTLASPCWWRYAEHLLIKRVLKIVDFLMSFLASQLHTARKKPSRELNESIVLFAGCGEAEIETCRSPSDLVSG